MQFQCKALVLMGLMCSLLFASCKKETSTQSQLLKTTKKGIFGRVLLYDEYGNTVPSYEGLTISGYSTDTIGYDTTNVVGQKIAICINTHFSTTVDNNGFFALDSCIKGYYTLQFEKNDYGKNIVFKRYHLSANGDTIKNIILSKKTFATVSIDSIGVSGDSKLLSIKRTVTLTANSSNEYSVVTRYFFSNDSLVNDKIYSYQWVSGATQGKAGEVSTVTILKATDLFQPSGIDVLKPIYVRAYIDNIQNYGYVDTNNTKKMIFPNVTSPSKVFSFQMK